MGSTDSDQAPARALLWVPGRVWQTGDQAVCSTASAAGGAGLLPALQLTLQGCRWSCRGWPMGKAGRSSSSAMLDVKGLALAATCTLLSSSEDCWIGAVHDNRSEATTEEGDCSAKCAAQAGPEPQALLKAILSASQCMNPGAPAGLAAQALTPARSQSVPGFVATAAACRRCLQVQSETSSRLALSQLLPCPGTGRR